MEDFVYIDHKRACLEPLSWRRRRGYKYFLPVGSRFEIFACGGWVERGDENWIKYTRGRRGRIPGGERFQRLNDTIRSFQLMYFPFQFLPRIDSDKIIVTLLFTYVLTSCYYVSKEFQILGILYFPEYTVVSSILIQIAGTISVL